MIYHSRLPKLSLPTLLSLIISILIFLLGVYLRVHNLSPQKIYPDSYQSLLTATFISQYHSVVGYLGPGGMVYPDFFAWTRPGYPLIILLVSLLTKNLVSAANIVSLLAGILSLIFSFFLGKNFFKSTLAGICSLLLVSLSFNHIVWGGFILTEALSVCLMLLFLILLLKGKRRENPSHVALGLIAGLLILTRYEYALLLLPLGIYVWYSRVYTVQQIFIALGSFVVFLLLIFRLLFPLKDTLVIFFSQTQDLLSKLLVVLLIIGTLWYMYHKLPKKLIVRTCSILKPVGILGMWMLFGYMLLQNFLPEIFSFGLFYLSALRHFIVDDVLLSVFFVLGSSLFLWRGGKNLYGVCIALTLLLLYTVYLRTNPEMERYITHLIPFLLLPATYGLVTTIHSLLPTPPLKHKMQPLTNPNPHSPKLSLKTTSYPLRPLPYVSLTFLILLIPLQLLASFQGIRNWGDKTWFQTSYDEQAALITNSYIKEESQCKKRGTKIFPAERDRPVNLSTNENSTIAQTATEENFSCRADLQDLHQSTTVLLVSFPEPYFFVTRKTTYSLADTYPYVFLPKAIVNQPMIISDDMGMHDLFPHFSNFLQTRMQDREVAHFFVHRPYHFSSYSKKETIPVTLYRTTGKELLDRITKATNK